MHDRGRDRRSRLQLQSVAVCRTLVRAVFDSGPAKISGNARHPERIPRDPITGVLRRGYSLMQTPEKRGIAGKRIEDRIEPQQRRREGRGAVSIDRSFRKQWTARARPSSLQREQGSRS